MHDAVMVMQKNEASGASWSCYRLSVCYCFECYCSAGNFIYYHVIAMDHMSFVFMVTSNKQ